MTNYPVTEFAFLNILPPHTLRTPTLKSGLLAGSEAQAAWSGCPVHFFSPHKEGEAGEDSKTSIYIISGWKSAQAHHEWIVSPKNQEIMSSFGEAAMLEVGGLAHLDIAFIPMKFDECRAIVWRKRSTHDGDSTSEGWGSGFWDKGDNGDDSPDPTEQNNQAARMLWSHRGRAVDAEEEYELVGYSEGQLPSFGEPWIAIHKLEFA